MGVDSSAIVWCPKTKLRANWRCPFRGDRRPLPVPVREGPTLESMGSEETDGTIMIADSPLNVKDNSDVTVERDYEGTEKL